MKVNNKKKKLVLLLSCIGIACILVGVTYSFVTFVFQGHREHTIDLKGLSFSYEEGASGLSLNNVAPMNDTDGLASGNDYTFRVSATSSVARDIPYYIYLSLDDENSLKNEYVRLNITNTTLNKTVGPVNVSQLDFNSKNDYYLVRETFSFDGTTTSLSNTYKLTIWVNENYVKGNNYKVENNEQITSIGGETFNFKISVATGELPLDPSGANAPVLASNMIPVYYDSTEAVWKKSKADNSGVEATYKLGDITGDGKVNTSDVIKINLFLNGDNQSFIYQSGDVDGDGFITITDKDLINSYAQKQITTFPAGEPLEEKTYLIPWYDYNAKQWANAVTVTESNGSRSDLVDAAPGTPIPMERINTMWVWIPRFSAVGDTANYNGGTVDAPGAFDITFVSKTENAHDAFDFGGAVSGFWMGKFETTGSVSSACTNTSCNVSNVTILPYREPIRYQSVSSFFYISRSMENSGNAYGFDKTKDTTLDTHMLKNSEWGAVAYLTQSIYGRCSSSTSCVEVSFNNYFEDNGIAATGGYNYLENISQSTTGNAYGVYDMSGNLYEYVMGVYWDGSKLWSGMNSNYNSGFNGCLGSSCSSTLETGLSYPNGKYYNLYTTDTNYTTAGLQHAMTETYNWYGDGWGFVTSDNPWIMRGGSWDDIYAGLFDFLHGNGNDGDMLGPIGSRFSIIIN